MHTIQYISIQHNTKYISLNTQSNIILYKNFTQQYTQSFSEAYSLVASSNTAEQLRAKYSISNNTGLYVSVRLDDTLKVSWDVVSLCYDCFVDC